MRCPNVQQAYRLICTMVLALVGKSELCVEMNKLVFQSDFWFLALHVEQLEGVVAAFVSIVTPWIRPSEGITYGPHVRSWLRTAFTYNSFSLMFRGTVFQWLRERPLQFVPRLLAAAAAFIILACGDEVAAAQAFATTGDPINVALKISPQAVVDLASSLLLNGEGLLRLLLLDAAHHVGLSRVAETLTYGWNRHGGVMTVQPTSESLRISFFAQEAGWIGLYTPDATPGGLFDYAAQWEWVEAGTGVVEVPRGTSGEYFVSLFRGYSYEEEGHRVAICV